MVADVAPGWKAIRVGCTVGVVCGVSGMEGGCVSAGGGGVAVGGCDVAVGGIAVGGTGVAVGGTGVAVGAAGVGGISTVVGGCEPVQAPIMTVKVKSSSGHRITFLFISLAPCWVDVFLSAGMGGRSCRALPEKWSPLTLLNHKGAAIARAKAAKNRQTVNGQGYFELNR